MPVVVVDIEVVDDGEEEEVEEVEQGSLQGSWGGIEVEEKLLVELDPVELLTSLYGKTPRIGAVVVESACLLILILDSVVVGNSWQGEHDSKEIEQ